MGILDDLNALAPVEPAPRPKLEYVAPGTRPEPDNLLGDVWGRRAPRPSAELERILSIPRRQVSEEDKEAMVELMGRRLRRPDRLCACASYNRPCIKSLKKTQAWALYEMGIVGGLLGPIVVGGGKTGLGILAPMVIPNCQTAVLIVPPKLVEQLKSEYMLWAEHWQVPSLICPKGWAVIKPGRPVIHVVPTSKLSLANATRLLEVINPDTILIDEVHKFRYPDAARTARLLRFLAAYPARLCSWSGSMTDKSIKDYAHCAGLALGKNSPLPLDRDVLTEWAGSIDPPKPGQAPAPIGALKALCENGETLRSGFRRRLLETRGVVATDDPGIGASLYVHEREPAGGMPDSIREALRDLRATWQRPDGEELVDAYSLARCARELAAGFFYRWIYPRGEPVALIKEWLLARKAWHAEVRDKLKRLEPDMDSPLLLAKAAIRFYWRDEETGKPYDGPLPVWESHSWLHWRRIRDQVRPETEAVWIDDYLAQDAAAWGRDNLGIIWYEHTAFGEMVAEISGLPLHRGGSKAEEKIKAERGDRSIVVSIGSHGEGRDGLQFLFKQQIVANPPVSRATGGAGRWEQLLGRLHREGFKWDEVDTWMYRHTVEMREAWDRAQQLARYVTGTMGSYQKLLACAPTWSR